jgi:hypothetical protein
MTKPQPDQLEKFKRAARELKKVVKAKPKPAKPE